MKDIRYIIASNVLYHRVTLPTLLPSLYQTGIEPERIFVAVGGAAERRDVSIEGVMHMFVKQRSFDWTGIIEVVRRELPGDAWFWLHDTCEAGPNFRQLAENNYDPNAEMTVAYVAHGGGQSNLGLYSTTMLQRHHSYWLSLEGISKADGLPHEGYAYRADLGTKAEYPNAQCLELGYRDIYGNGTIRRIEHYTGVDLFKYKANWGQTTGGAMIIQP